MRYPSRNLNLRNPILCYLVAGSLLFLASFVSPAAPILAQQASEMITDEMKFPYDGLILIDKATVHSGPGSVHYATDRLPQGNIVQVHRHDPGGWCAVRPPKGSFSLVPESALEIVGDNVGKVVVDGVQAWVGTRLGPVDKPMWQIKLRENELVKVLGEVSWPSPEGHSTIWFQIAPPAGEFRWVKMSDIQLPANGNNNTEQVARPAAAGSSPSSKWQSTAEKGNAETKPNPADMQPQLQQTFTEQRTLEQITATTAAPSSNFGTPKPSARSTQASRVATNVNFDSNEVVQAGLQTAIPAIESPSSMIKETPEVGGWRPASKPFDIKPSSMANDIRKTNIELSEGFSAPAIPDTEAFAHPIQRQPPTRIASTTPDSISADLLRSSASGNSSPGSSSTYSPMPKIANQQQSLPRAILNVPLQMTRPSPELMSIDMALTSEMLKSPDKWNLDDLEARANKVLRTPTQTLDTENARIMLNKLENCRRIRAQHVAAYLSNRSGFASGPFGNQGSPVSTRVANGRVGSQPSANRSPIGSGLSGDQFSRKYDAVGWLNELVQDGGRSESTFVIQDDNGQVTHHISPTPGLNLNEYLKTKVGVSGRRGFHRRLNMDHVTAERVTPLTIRR